MVEALRDAGAVRLHQLTAARLVGPSQDPEYRRAGVSLREVACARTSDRSPVLVLCSAIAAELLQASDRVAVAAAGGRIPVRRAQTSIWDPTVTVRARGRLK